MAEKLIAKTRYAKRKKIPLAKSQPERLLFYADKAGLKNVLCIVTYSCL